MEDIPIRNLKKEEKRGKNEKSFLAFTYTCKATLMGHKCPLQIFAKKH